MQLAKDDFKAFAKGIPNIGNMDKKNLFNILQKSMGVKNNLENCCFRDMATCT